MTVVGPGDRAERGNCRRRVSQVQERRARGYPQRSPGAASRGTIDKATMRNFDESCLAAPMVALPAQIKRICERLGSINWMML